MTGHAAETAGRTGRITRLLAVVGLGVAFALVQLGVFALAQSPASSGATIPMQLFAFLNLGSVWAVVGMVGGGVMPRLRGSIVGGILTLLAAVWTYYATSWGIHSSLFPVVVWSTAAVVGGAVLGAVGALGRRRDGWSLVPWVGGPMLVVAETGREVLMADEPGYLPMHVVAWILAGVGVVIATRRSRAATRTASV
jgi:hypothetical protein